MGPAPLAAALQRRKSLLEAETAIQGRDLAPWAFTNRVDRPVDALNLVHRVALPLLEKAGLRRIRFHDLRHTAASHLVMRGASLTDVKEILGHRDLRMTLRYSHLSPAHLRAAVDRLDGLTSAPAADPATTESVRS